VQPWVKSRPNLKPWNGAKDKLRLFSVAPAGALKFTDTKPTIVTVGYFLNAAPQLLIVILEVRF
jgi:hypothetical protein